MKRAFWVWTMLLLAVPATSANNLDFENLPPLSEIAISNEEIPEPWLIPLANDLQDTPLPAQIDITDELASNCAMDCVKKIWIARRGKALTLILLRMSGPEMAAKAIANLWIIYSTLEGWDFRARDEYSGLADNYWLGRALRGNRSSSKFHYVLVTTRGPIVLVLIHRIEIKGFFAEQDSAYFLSGLEYLAQLQIQKLQDAGYPP